MQYITEYISDNYMTLMLLTGLAVILLANRRTKIEGTQYVWAIMGLAFIITVFEYLEKWCDTYNKPEITGLMKKKLGRIDPRGRHMTASNMDEAFALLSDEVQVIFLDTSAYTCVGELSSISGQFGWY